MVKSFKRGVNHLKPHTVAFLNTKIQNSYFEEAINAIAECHKTFGFEAKSMLLAGLSGAGKTNIAEHYCRMYRPEETPTKRIMPVLFASLKEMADIGSFLSALLAACGDPNPTKGTVRDMHRRLDNHLIKLCVELIIIDEIHNTLPSYTEKRATNAATLIRSIMNDHQIPIILVGLPSSQRLITLITGKEKEQKQLARRFVQPYYLRAVEFGTNRWENMLEIYQERLCVPCLSLTTHEMKSRFYVATNGLHGGMTNLLYQALELTDGKRQIDRAILTKAYKKTESIVTLNVNPFECELKDIKPLLESAIASHEVDIRFWKQLLRGEK